MASQRLYPIGIQTFREIRTGLYRSLLPHYIGQNTAKGTTTIAKMSALIRRGDLDGFLNAYLTQLATGELKK